MEGYAVATQLSKCKNVVMTLIVQLVYVVNKRMLEHQFYLLGNYPLKVGIIDLSSKIGLIIALYL